MRYNNINSDYNVLISKIDSLNEGLFNFKNIIKDVKKFIINYKNDDSILSKIEGLLKKVGKKYAIGFIIATALNVGISKAEIKSIIDKNNIEYNINDVNKNIFNYDIAVDLKDIDFETGEYEISKSDINKIIRSIEKNIGENTIKISGVITAKITVEDNKYYNQANDEDYNTFIKGGLLQEKRLESAKELVEKISEYFKSNYNIEVDIDIKTGRGEKSLDFQKFNITNKYEMGFINNDVDSNIKNNKNIDNNNSVEKSDTDKDIKVFSRNYQFSEILKLGGIYDTEFTGDKAKNEYSKWILKMRKHPEILLNNVQKALKDEYDIEFDETIKNINIISKKAEKGKTNVANQYRKESYYTRFKDFTLNENSNDKVYNKWNDILGVDFPNLTSEQANKFNDNITLFLKFLKQMYGSTFEFKYKKI